MSGIADLLIPKEKKFFEFLLKQVTCLNDSAISLYELSRKSLNENNISKTLRYIEERNENSDTLSKDIIIQIHESFITPIDREELHFLTVSIDCAVNSLEKIATTIYYLRLPENNDNKFLISQIALIKDSSEMVLKIFDKPLKLKDNTDNINNISKNYKKAQKELRKALSSLFQTTNAIQIIKMKELFDATSDSMKNLKSIADIFERVLINHS